MGAVYGLFKKGRGVADAFAVAILKRLLYLSAVGVVFKAFSVRTGVVYNIALGVYPRNAVAVGGEPF